MGMSQDEIDRLITQSGPPEDEKTGIDNAIKIYEKMTRLYSNAINNIFPILIETEQVQVEPGKISKGQLADIFSSQPSDSTLFSFKCPRLSDIRFIGSLDHPIAMIISQRMMGQSGETVLTEALLSALNEAFNNILGAWDTSLADEFGFEVSHQELKFLDTNTPDVIKTQTGMESSSQAVLAAFSIRIDEVQGGLSLMVSADSLMQVYEKHPSFKRTIVKTAVKETPVPEPTMKIPPISEPVTDMKSEEPVAASRPAPSVPVARFEELTPHQTTEASRGIDLILDVPLVVAVELGRKSLSVKDVLELVPGSLVELDKLAGEAVDLLVNGKLFAKGEVVVIDENFGVRISTIISPKERIESLR